MNSREESALPAPRATRRKIMIGAAAAFGGVTISSIGAAADTDSGISHSADAIHQEPIFKASRNRVYEALIDAKQFDKVAHLSAAMRSMAPGGKPTELGRNGGDAFTLFGGYISGRNIDLVPNERIVQAWRSMSWKSGDYSIASFKLVEQGTDTKIVFDHRGFPAGEAQHLADGWKANYWEPLEKYLAAKK